MKPLTLDPKAANRSLNGGSPMGEVTICTCQEKHQRHLCVLRGKGMTSIIKKQTSAPNVACHTCGEEANSEDDVCVPVPLFV